jgi:hypothetical protein
MESKRGILTLFVVTIVVFLVFLPCSVAQDNSDQDQPQNMPRMGIERPGQRPEPGSGDRRGGPGERSGGRGRPGDRRGAGQRFGGRPDDRWRRPELTNDQIDDVLKELTKRDPNTAKKLNDLRQKDPNEFKNELRRNAWQEISRVIINGLRERQREEFLNWLGNYVPKEAESLTQLKETDPTLYTQKYDLIWGKYRLIYDRARRSPELAPVLIEDMQLNERENELLKNISATKNEQEKTELTAQLEKVEAYKYDLIVRRKQIEYEDLLKRLQDLQNDIKASLADINIWKGEEFKAEKVKERVEELTSNKPKWDWPPSIPR